MTTLETSYVEKRSSPHNTLLQMFCEPSKAFSDIRNHGRPLLPLLLITLGSALIIFWYYNSVDFLWLQDHLVTAIPDAAQREAAKKFMTKGAMSTMGVVSILIGIPLFSALLACYFLIVAKIKNLPISFSKWFAFVTWSSVPGLLILPLGAIQILLSHNGQLAPEQLNPLTLNQLLFHVDMAHPWKGLLDSVNFTTLWSLGLMTVGFQAWSKLSRATSLFFVLLPSGVIYGIWVAYLLLSKST